MYKKVKTKFLVLCEIEKRGVWYLLRVGRWGLKKSIVDNIN
jgi:hypothetical protein